MSSIDRPLSGDVLSDPALLQRHGRNARTLRIATREPDNLWRQTKALEQLDEIIVLCDDDRAGGPRRGEHGRILRVPQSELANRLRHDAKV